MTEEKQIEEMARIISEYDECGNCKVCKYHNCCSSEYHATNLYNAGYRKQAEGECKNERFIQYFNYYGRGCERTVLYINEYAKTNNLRIINISHYHTWGVCVLFEKVGE